ncbi:MAG: kynureninase [Phycisphaerales bacterium]|nr:kynureninase [Phycisphaerales bacterium]
MTFSPDLALAHQLDASDPLRHYRDLFEIPRAHDIANLSAPSPFPPDQPCIYMCGNSLGCMPRRARELINQELDDWARLAVEAHLHGKNPWLPYHEQLRGPLARLIGAHESEVVAMNSLTVNLHMLMVSFYRPTRDRYKIMIEDSAFPSDSYAVASQASFHGFDPASAIVRLKPRPGEHTLRTDDILNAITREGPALALVMLGAVNYLTGQWFEIAPITAAAHSAGALAGWDLAHAAGNVPMQLHDWNADFAAWCSYKYLNGGPGAIAGAFIHQRHLVDHSLPRFTGWWGNDPATRFKMGPDFTPIHTADAWAVSNPPILSLTPLLASLEIFDKAGIHNLRNKALQLTAYLEYHIDRLNTQRPDSNPHSKIEIITPRDPNQRGSHLSLVFSKNPRSALKALQSAGAVCDFREPNVIRLAPVPLYNTFTEIHHLAQALANVS